jgi:hypothetical protein
MYILFFCYLLDVCTGFSAKLKLTKSRICVVLLKYPECIVPLHISRTLQFDWNTHKTEFTLSAMVQVFVWYHSKDLAAVYAIGNNGTISLPL